MAPQGKEDPHPSLSSSSDNIPASMLLGLGGSKRKAQCAGKRMKQLSSNSSETLCVTLLFILPLAQLPEVHKRS